MVSEEYPKNGSTLTLLGAINTSPFIMFSQKQCLLDMAFHKAQFLGHFSSYFISTTINTVSNMANLTYLRMTAINVSHSDLKALKKRLNIDLKLLHHWLSANKIGLNVAKTETILFRHPTKKINYDLKLKLHGKRLIFNESTKYLGVCIDKHLIWKNHK